MHLPDIQKALKEERLDGWLFFDHHFRDPLAYTILGLPKVRTPTRRWYYFVPAEGEPKALVHRIESGMLDGLEGSSHIYSGWNTQVQGLQLLLQGSKRIAMQYSPLCAVPYVSLVDGGTLELVRSIGVDIATSANLVQLFEARWSAEQFEMHMEAGRRVDHVRAAAFARIGSALATGETIDEWRINRFIRDGFEQAGLETDHGPIVAVNAHMSDPHYEPEEQNSLPIRPGDAVLIDMWAKLKRPGAVYYDITWTGYCGAEIPEQIENIFRIVKGGRDAAVAQVQSTIAANRPLHGFEVDDAARSFIDKEGYGEFFVHRTGHSIGEEVHGTGANMDNLETHDDRKVIPHTCFSIEPGVYLPQFGIRSEVNMFIHPGSAQVTGEIQQELVRIL